METSEHNKLKNKIVTALIHLNRLTASGDGMKDSEGIKPKNLYVHLMGTDNNKGTGMGRGEDRARRRRRKRKRGEQL